MGGRGDACTQAQLVPSASHPVPPLLSPPGTWPGCSPRPACPAGWQPLTSHSSHPGSARPDATPDQSAPQLPRTPRGRGGYSLPRSAAGKGGELWRKVWGQALRGALHVALYQWTHPFPNLPSTSPPPSPPHIGCVVGPHLHRPLRQQQQQQRCPQTRGEGPPLRGTLT